MDYGNSIGIKSIHIEGKFRNYLFAFNIAKSLSCNSWLCTPSAQETWSFISKMRYRGSSVGSTITPDFFNIIVTD